MSLVDAVIFDFDGLIVDTETPLFEVWRDVFAEAGVPLRQAEWVRAVGTHGGFDPVARLAERQALLTSREALEERTRSEHWRRCTEAPLLPGVKERVQDAQTRGLRLGVASSSPAWWVRHWLVHHLLYDHFAVVCTREDVSRVKPSPELFLVAAARLRVKPGRCLVFEDSPHGVEAARAAGMWTVAVPGVVTTDCDFARAHLRLSSLAELSLAGIESRLASPRGTCQG